MPDALSRDQRDEKLAGFKGSIERRIFRLQSFAVELETSLPTPDGDRSKVDRVAASLNAFCKTTIAGLKEVEPALSMDWQSRALGGIKRRSHTLSIDLGTYCGEVAIRCVPQHGWVTGETRHTRRTVMETGGRVVIGHNPAALPKTITNQLDAHAIAAFRAFADRPLPQVKKPMVVIILHSFRPLPMNFTPEGSPRQGHHLRSPTRTKRVPPALRSIIKIVVSDEGHQDHRPEITKSINGGYGFPD